MNGISVNNNRLVLDGIDVQHAAEKYGTPLFLYGGDSVVSGIDKLKDAVGDEISIFYSIKANPAIGICRLICNSRIDGAEIASSGELVTAMHSGFDTKNILFAGPGKTNEELTRAISTGVWQINAESTHEVERIQRIAAQHGVRQQVGIRVNLQTADSGHGLIQTSGGAQKFGIDESRVPDAIKTITKHKNIEFAGLHTMLGSQVLDTQAMLRSCKRSIDMAVRVGETCGVQIPTLNFGGGLGVQHIEDDTQFDLDSFGVSLNKIITRSRNSPVVESTKFILEPGRVLVSEHGLYLSKVIDVKESCGQTYAILDGGIHHALLPITANNYRVTIVDRVDDPGSHAIVLAGPLCTSADQWRPQVTLPNIQKGDIVAMYNSGAYGLSASMTMFLSKGIPAEVLIIDEKCHIIRQRSCPEDVLTGQHIPESLH